VESKLDLLLTLHGRDSSHPSAVAGHHQSTTASSPPAAKRLQRSSSEAVGGETTAAADRPPRLTEAGRRRCRLLRAATVDVHVPVPPLDEVFDDDEDDKYDDVDDDDERGVGR